MSEAGVIALFRPIFVFGTSNNYRQDNNYGQQYGKSKNTSEKVKMGLIIIIVFIVVACLFVIGRAKIKSNNNSTGNVNLSTSKTTTESDKSTSVIENKEFTSSVSTSKSNSYKVNFSGFKFYIPDTLTYKINYTEKSIDIGDIKSTWVAEIAVEQGPFQQLKQNKNAIPSTLIEEMPGITVSNPTIETIGGIEYVLLECNYAGTNLLVGYVELNSMYIAGICVQNEDNDFNRNMVENLSSIINTAEYTGNSTYMKVNENIKMTNINKVIEKVTE